MLFKRKNKSLIEKYDGYHIQIKYDCKKIPKYFFIHLKEEITKDLLEYFKPFGDLIPVTGSIYEIVREEMYKIMIPIGKKAMHVEIFHLESEHKQMILRAVDIAVNGADSNIISKCTVKAINFEDDKFKIDRTKCTFCLDCLIP